MTTEKNIRDFIGRGRLLAWTAAGALLVAPVIASTGGEAEVAGDQSRGERAWTRASERFDQNGDGQITLEELGSEQRLAHLDRNGDQVVTAADFEGMPPRRHRARHLMAAADADRDRQVTQEEFQAFIAGLDTNSDGVISDEERQAHRKARLEARQKDGVETDDAVAALDANPYGFTGDVPTEDLSKVFTKMDRNGDGVVSKADRPERKARGERPRRGPRIGARLMKQADLNDDRQLTRNEWTGYLATVDSNTDGLLSREELEAIRPADAPERPDRPVRADRPSPEVSRLTALFDRQDADGNGVIEGDEWPRRGPRGDRPRGGGRRGGPGF